MGLVGGDVTMVTQLIIPPNTSPHFAPPFDWQSHPLALQAIGQNCGHEWGKGRYSDQKFLFKKYKFGVFFCLHKVLSGGMNETIRVGGIVKEKPCFCTR